MDKKHIRKLIDNVNKEKEKLRARQNYLNKLSGELWTQLSEEFECPLGLSNYDAVCPNCDYVLPEFALGSAVGTKKGFQRFSLWFPRNYDTGKREKFIIKTGVDGCREWKKKEKTVACGCGGSWNCECGYHEEFCMTLNDTMDCPFCGRTLHTKAVVYNPLSFGPKIGEKDAEDNLP